MRITLNNWLYNAGIIGLLRILKSQGIDFNDQLKKGYFELLPVHLENFHFAYFKYVLEYINPFKMFYQVKNASKAKIKLEQFKDFSKVENDLKNQIIKLQEDFHNNLNEALNNKEYDNWNEYIKSTCREFFVNLNIIIKNVKSEDKKTNNVINKLLDKPQKSKFQNKLNEISEMTTNRILDWYFLYVCLQPFYKNKAVIGQAEAKPIRIQRFYDDFIQPCINNINNKANNGLKCKFCNTQSIDINNFKKEDSDKFTFNETLFYPVGTTVQFKNFFYNMQSDLFLCDVCELIILCAWAGFNEIPYQFRTGDSDTEYIFVNLPSLDLMLKENDYLKELYAISQKKRKDTMYEEIMASLFTKEKEKKSYWVMQNVLFVEIKPTARKDTQKPIFKYFHIGKDMAELFINKNAINCFNKIYGRLKLQDKIEINLKREIIHRILEGNELSSVNRKILTQVLDNRNIDPWNMFNISLIHSIRKQIWVLHNNNKLKGVNPMAIENESKKLSGILYGISQRGTKLIGKFSTNPEEDWKQRQRKSYRMLSLIRTGKYTEFYDIIMKLHIDAQLPIPENLLGFLNIKDDIDFEAKAYAFMSGFLQDATRKENQLKPENQNMEEQINE